MSSPNSAKHPSQPSIYEGKPNFMSWLGKIFKGGSSSRGVPGGQQPQLLGDENTALRTPVRSLDDRSRANRDKEDLDLAVARSQSEDLERSNGYIRIDNDLAKLLHDSHNSSLYPLYAPPYAPRDYRVCGGCCREIGYGNYLRRMGTFFHPECFCCHACGYPITEQEFSVSGNKTHHKLCFKELTHPKCEVCHQFQMELVCSIIYHPYWYQKCCPSHEHDNTAKCCSCERLESWDARYVSLGDGRSLCLECIESAIMDTGDCQPLYHAIRDYYEGMNMKIDQQIPMVLVERQVLNEAIEMEEHSLHHVPEAVGYCLSDEETLTSILKRPRMGGRGGLLGLRPQPQRLIRKCEVTAILVLYGLPRLLTGAILAHELMHAWLSLKGFRNLSPEVEEGICQVLSHMWLESEVMPGFRNMPSTSAASSSSWSTSSKKGGKSGVENKLGEFFMHQIAHDTSPAYGGGFRAANEAVNKYGLRRTLDHIRLTGVFPL